MRADLVLLDPNKICDQATYAHPLVPCEGIHRVMVQGEWAWVNGRAAGAAGESF